MKEFTTIILVLLYIVYTTAIPLKSFEKCKSQILSYNYDCTAEISEDRETACLESLSKKCQKFFKNPLSIEEECQNITETEKTTLIEFIHEKHADNDLYCHVKRDGQYCPFSNIVISKNPITEEEFKEAIEATCKLEECIQLTIKTMKTTLNNTKYQQAPSETYLRWYKEGLAYLESSTCNPKSYKLF